MPQLWVNSMTPSKQYEEEINMTTQQVIALMKEKLGKDITEQEAQDCINGKTAIPDELLDIVSGGGEYSTPGNCNAGYTQMIK